VPFVAHVPQLVVGLAEVLEQLPVQHVDFAGRGEDRHHPGDGVHDYRASRSPGVKSCEPSTSHHRSG
jgi:hypothetical protein